MFGTDLRVHLYTSSSITGLTNNNSELLLTRSLPYPAILGFNRGIFRMRYIKSIWESSELSISLLFDLGFKLIGDVKFSSLICTLHWLGDLKLKETEDSYNKIIGTDGRLRVEVIKGLLEPSGKCSRKISNIMFECMKDFNLGGSFGNKCLRTLSCSISKSLRNWLLGDNQTT